MRTSLPHRLVHGRPRGLARALPGDLRGGAHRRPAARLGAVIGLMAAWVAWAPCAAADEIVIRDAETCERKSIRAAEIPAETWTEVQYREKDRGPVKTVPSAQVIEIRRDATDAQAQKLAEGMEELARGNLREAREALRKVSGGGWQVDSEGKRTFTPFTANDPPGKAKRPSWVSEYAHFAYAKAMVLEGLAEQKADLLEEALLALDDEAVPGGDGKARSGGFLARFKEGNSRWFPEALVLKARALVGLKRYDDAAKVYGALYDAAVSLGIGPRWALEAKIGPGEIAEAQDKPVEAVTAYTAASDVMRILLEKESRGCFRKELGRMYSLARNRAAAVKLRSAEEHQSKAEFQELRKFLEEGSAEALRKRFSTRPKPEVDAIVAGARDPSVQAVTLNGMGLAYFNEGRFEEAVLAFRGVTVKHFQVPEEPARALYYLAKAAEAASKQAKGEAASWYAALQADAVKSLKTDYPESPYARK